MLPNHGSHSSACAHLRKWQYNLWTFPPSLSNPRAHVDANLLKYVCLLVPCVVWLYVCVRMCACMCEFRSERSSLPMNVLHGRTMHRHVIILQVITYDTKKYGVHSPTLEQERTANYGSRARRGPRGPLRRPAEGTGSH